MQNLAINSYTQAFSPGSYASCRHAPGLDEEQLGELEYCVAELLEEPWNKEAGRPHELTLREVLVVTCGYLRQNIVEDVWTDIFDVDQSTISRYITFLTPLTAGAKLTGPRLNSTCCRGSST